MNAWPTIALGEVLCRSERTIRIDPEASYKEVTVRINGKGVVERRQVRGVEIAADRRYQARSGQFIISRIDARHGASGLIPNELDEAIVTNDFPLFDIAKDRLDGEFLGWMSKTTSFVDLCKRASEGTTNRVRLSEDRFKALSIPLPPLDEQRRIANRLATLAEKARQVGERLDAVERDAELLLALYFRDITSHASLLPIYSVAPVVRRPVEIRVDTRYREIGARSFGKGLFAKPDFDGATATWEKPVWVESGDLVLSNIKAWEGAIAVARDAHDGCIASHRYITCVPDPTKATAGFLAYYLLSGDGLEKVVAASPGTADRNRTLSLGNLGKIEVPIPPLTAQQSFDRLHAEISALKARHTSIRAANSALLPATLERVFS